MILQAESKSDGEGSALGQDGHIVIIMRHIIGHHSEGMASDGYIGTSSYVESCSLPGTEVLFMTPYLIMLHILRLNTKHLIDGKASPDKRTNPATW